MPIAVFARKSIDLQLADQNIAAREAVRECRGGQSARRVRHHPGRFHAGATARDAARLAALCGGSHAAQGGG